MKTIFRTSTMLIKPDNCDDKREIFIESVSPIKFQIDFYYEKAIELWDKSSTEYLPILPWGYHWEKVNKRYGIYKLNYANDHEIILILYGPDEKDNINYNLLVDERNSYTLFHTRSNKDKRLSARDRRYPSPIKTNASGYSTDIIQYMPGHCGDHVDAIIPTKDIVKKYGVDCCSSFNSNNYIPEIQKDYWGLYMRKCLVDEQRKQSHNYAQLVEYPDNPILTFSGTAVPESVYFFRLDDQYKQKQISWIDWSVDYNQYKKPKSMKMSEHMQSFSTSLEASPHPWLWDIRSSDRTWRKFVRNNRKLGHDIRNQSVTSYNHERDQLYAYMNSSSLEYTNSYASISTALAASPLNKINLTKANLEKAIEHGEKLVDLDAGILPIDENRLKWVKKYHKDQMPGFEEDKIVDVVKRLSFP